MNLFKLGLLLCLVKCICSLAVVSNATQSTPSPVFANDTEYWNAACRKEHGTCDRDQYENLRLVALRSTGCRRFCQCAHASTEIDGSVTYYWVAQICPAGTLFDDSLPAPVCNHEDEVECSGGQQPDGDACEREHGTCDRDEYENVRLVALVSSGCQHFCQCAHASTELDGSVTYKWVEKTCPAGTLFDESLSAPVCNHAHLVSCGAVSGGDGSTNGNNGYTTLDRNAACRAEHGTCNKHEYENIRLVALVSSGCQKFCQCAHASTELDGSVTYYWVEQTCPRGTLFDMSLPTPVCNHAHLVKCSSGGGVPDDDACKTEHGTCDRDEYENVRLVALVSSGCQHFCQCAHASTELDGSVTYKWVEKTCPAGTLFDESLPAPVCNHAHLVSCGAVSGNNGSSNGHTTVNPNDACRREHGSCNRYEYENVRLVALESSGCKKFCQCAHASTELDGSVTYYWVEQTCPDGTLFDQSLPTPVCNHASAVTCGGGDSTGDGSTNGNNGYTTLDRNAACRAEHGTCNKHEYENVRLVALVSSGCQKFCQCAHASTEPDGSVTYYWVEQTCPRGTLFDMSLPTPVCNHAHLVECTSGSGVPDDDACKTEHGSCSGYEYSDVRLVSLRSSGCQQFCQCAFASTELDGSVTRYWVKHTCPPGTLFDNRIRVCNYAAIVQC